MFGGPGAGGVSQVIHRVYDVIKNTPEIPQIKASNWILSVVSDRIKI